MSNEAKFTKGPWNLDKFRSLVDVNGKSVSIRVSISIPMALYTDEEVANAHLIAAAPEMYEELQEVSNWLNSQLGMGDWHKDIEKLLAKARGEHDIN